MKPLHWFECAAIEVWLGPGYNITRLHDPWSVVGISERRGTGIRAPHSKLARKSCSRHSATDGGGDQCREA